MDDEMAIADKRRQAQKLEGPNAPASLALYMVAGFIFAFFGYVSGRLNYGPAEGMMLAAIGLGLACTAGMKLMGRKRPGLFDPRYYL